MSVTWVEVDIQVLFQLGRCAKKNKKKGKKTPVDRTTAEVLNVSTKWNRKCFLCRILGKLYSSSYQRLFGRSLKILDFVN